MEKKTYTIHNRASARHVADLVQAAPDGWTVTIAEPTRSLAQNSLMWDLLTALQDQVEWHGVKLSKEEWKDAITAALKGQKVIPGLNGQGFVVLGAHTSKMTIAEMNDVIEFCYAFGTEKNVRWKSNREDT